MSTRSFSGLYAKGLTTGEITAHFAEIYGASVSKETVSRITDKVMEEMVEWANRPIYAAIGVSLAGEKDVLGLWAGAGGEGAKFWMAVLAGLENRGVRDVFFLVCDGLKGLPEAVGNVWPPTTVQTCIIHLIRNTFRLASRRDWDRERPGTMDDEVETSAERVRHHLRRPLARGRNLLMKTAGNTLPATGPNRWTAALGVVRRARAHRERAGELRRRGALISGGNAKKRILSVLAAACVVVALVATPAMAYISLWQSTTDGWVQRSCANINHGHSSQKAFINSGSCNWRVGIRARWNEMGTDRTTAWIYGNTVASVSRDRIWLHQFRY